MRRARGGLSPRMLNLTRLAEYSPPPNGVAPWEELVETMRAAIERYILEHPAATHGPSRRDETRP